MSEEPYDVVNRQTGDVVGTVYLDNGRFVRFESAVVSVLEQMMSPTRVLTCADCGTRVKVPVDGADFNGDNPFYCLDCFKVRFQRGQL